MIPSSQVDEELEVVGGGASTSDLKTVMEGSDTCTTVVEKTGQEAEEMVKPQETVATRVENSAGGRQTLVPLIMAMPTTRVADTMPFTQHPRPARTPSGIIEDTEPVHHQEEEDENASAPGRARTGTIYLTGSSLSSIESVRDQRRPAFLFTTIPLAGNSRGPLLVRWVFWRTKGIVELLPVNIMGGSGPVGSTERRGGSCTMYLRAHCIGWRR